MLMTPYLQASKYLIINKIKQKEKFMIKKIKNKGNNLNDLNKNKDMLKVYITNIFHITLILIQQFQLLNSFIKRSTNLKP